MIRLHRRLALGLFSTLMLAGAASAQDVAYDDGRGYTSGYEASYTAASRGTAVHTEDRYGTRVDRSGSGYESGYAVEHGSRDGYERVSHEAGQAACDWNRPGDPRDPYACPSGYGLVTLPGSFFYSGGGVGPETTYYYGGGGGGFVYAGAGAGGAASASARAGAFAYARASASARVSFGGKRGGHPGKKGGGCGCR